MNIKEIIFDTLRLMKAAKLRTLLTMLGIIIGISSVIIINSIGKGETEVLKKAFDKMGSNLVLISFNQNYSGKHQVSMNDSFTKADIAGLNQNPNVEEVAVNASFNQINIVIPSDYTFGESDWIRATTASSSYFDISNSEFIAGRNYSKNEQNKFVVIGSELAKVLYGSPKDAIGKEIGFRILYCGDNSIKKCVVIGVIQNPYAEISKIGKSSTGRKLFYWPVSRYDEELGWEYNSLYIKFSKGVNIKTVSGDIIKQLANSKNLPEDLYSFYIINDSKKRNLAALNKQNLYVLIISAISLLVGGIVIMNLMLFTVTERTKEIGIKRAIGAKKRDIIIQFIVEAAFVSLIGGIIGIIIGIIGTFIAEKFVAVIPVISIYSIIISTFISIFIGVFFGLYPAIQAANLDPVEALRRE